MYGKPSGTIAEQTPKSTSPPKNGCHCTSVHNPGPTLLDRLNGSNFGAAVAVIPSATTVIARLVFVRTVSGPRPVGRFQVPTCCSKANVVLKLKCLRLSSHIANSQPVSSHQQLAIAPSVPPPWQGRPGCLSRQDPHSEPEDAGCTASPTDTAAPHRFRRAVTQCTATHPTRMKCPRQ
jgi:hypothetical protein